MGKIKAVLVKPKDMRITLKDWQAFNAPATFVISVSMVTQSVTTVTSLEGIEAQDNTCTSDFPQSTRL